MRVDTLWLDTMDGLRLQADLGLPDAIVGAAAVCHPHPLYGGDRFNTVVDALFRALPEHGFATVRFDFRGVHMSEGEHGGGVDERMDALAALELAGHFCGDGPLVLCGYSFGALVALNVTLPRLDGWVAVAAPLAMSPGAPVAAPDPHPKLLLVPAHDQYSPPEAVEPLARTWTNTTVEPVANADHFLGGRTAHVAERAVAFVSALAAR